MFKRESHSTSEMISQLFVVLFVDFDGQRVLGVYIPRSGHTSIQDSTFQLDILRVFVHTNQTKSFSSGSRLSVIFVSSPIIYGVSLLGYALLPLKGVPGFNESFRRIYRVRCGPDHSEFLLHPCDGVCFTVVRRSS